MCKRRHKVRNGQNLPHESPNFTNYFFQSNFTYNLSHFSTSLRPDYQNSFFEIFFFVFYSKLQDIYEHVYLASQIVEFQNGVGPTFTWSNEPWYIDISIPNIHFPIIKEWKQQNQKLKP